MIMFQKSKPPDKLTDLIFQSVINSGHWENYLKTFPEIHYFQLQNLFFVIFYNKLRSTNWIGLPMFVLLNLFQIYSWGLFEKFHPAKRGS